MLSRPFKEDRLLLAMDGVMSFALCPQVVSQASQYFRSSEKPKWSEWYEEKSLQLQIENYTCSTRLWMSYFICDNKHTFGKQMPPDLAMLLAFLIETVD